MDSVAQLDFSSSGGETIVTSLSGLPLSEVNCAEAGDVKL